MRAQLLFVSVLIIVLTDTIITQENMAVKDYFDITVI